MRRLVRQADLEGTIVVDSAGTGAWHVGEPRDRRSSEAGRRRGIPLTGRARQFVVDDFSDFDLVVAMDNENLRTLSELAPNDAARAKLRLLRSFDPDSPPGADVPDPYYGGPQGFERVLEICEAACDGLLAEIRRQHGV